MESWALTRPVMTVMGAISMAVRRTANSPAAAMGSYAPIELMAVQALKVATTPWAKSPRFAVQIATFAPLSTSEAPVQPNFTCPQIMIQGSVRR